MTAADAWVVVVPAIRQTETISAELIGEARRLVANGAVHALIVGHDISGESTALAKWGITSALLLDDSSLMTYHPETYARAVADAIAGADLVAVLFAGTVLGSDLGARVAQLIGRRFHSACVNFEFAGGAIKVTRSVAKARAHQIETADGAPYLLSLVPDTVGPGAPGAASSVPTKELKVTIDNYETSLRDLGFTPADPRTMDIRDAGIIVSGGRGVGGPEGFELLGEIADFLGGSVGASRRAVEAGWAPYERQVGQTGRVVRPRLYIAAGISGATQHLAGMREAETIIAINTDPGAPMLDVATLAVEGDLHEVLSAVVAQLRARQKGAA